MKHRSGSYPDIPALGSWGPRLRIFVSAIGKQWIILPATFAMATASGTSAIGLLFYVRDVFHAPPAIVALFAAAWTAAYAAACLGLRPLSFRLLPRHSLMIAAGGMAVCLVAILFVHSLAVAFLLYGLFGVSLSFFWPPIMGWLSVGLEERELSRVIGRYNLSWSTGGIISPFLGGVLYEMSRRLPLTVSFVLLAATALFIVGASLFLPKIKSDAHREGAPKRGVRMVPDHSTPLRFPARFVLFVTYFGFGIMANVLPLHLRDHMGASEGVAGLILLVRAATTTVAFLLLARSTFWQFRRTWILVGQVVVLLVLAVFSFATSIAVYAVGIALFGAAMALVYNSSVFHGISGSSSRAGRMAVHESTLNGGSVAGSIVGGAVYQAASINVTFLGSMVLAACSLVIVVVLMLRIGNPSPRSVRAA